MPELPVLKRREVVLLPQVLGFVEARQKGSHKQFRDADGGASTVPFYPGRDISPILPRQIARAIGVTVETPVGPQN